LDPYVRDSYQARLIAGGASEAISAFLFSLPSLGYDDGRFKFGFGNPYGAIEKGFEGYEKGFIEEYE
jgi:hypothetical protein